MSAIRQNVVPAVRTRRRQRQAHDIAFPRRRLENPRVAWASVDLIVNHIPRTHGDESSEGNLVGVTPYSISASGWPAASALIQARQRSQERYRPVASVSWRSTMGKVE